MTDATKTKSVAPETVRLFEIIGFGQTNEEEHKHKVKNIMEVTGCEQEMAILTLHDCNDETEAIQRLLDSNTGTTQEGWVTKKKPNKKKVNPTTSVENGPLDTPKAYVTDGHSGESGVEGRRGVRSRERERTGSHKGSGDSWDGDETTETSKGEFRFERNRQIRNGFSGYSPTYNDRRNQEGENRQQSRIFMGKRNERHPQDDDRYQKERFYRDGQNKERRNRPYRERRPYRNGDDRDQPEHWNKHRYNRDRNETGEHEQDDRGRNRNFGWKGGHKRTDKERMFDSTNRSSKTTPDLNGGVFVNSRESADPIDWENPVLSNTDWGDEEGKKEYEDEDKSIEALLSGGCEFHNSNFNEDNVEADHRNVRTSASPHPPPNQDPSHSYPIFSPQTKSHPTPSASIPVSPPPSNQQAVGVVFQQSGRMNIKRKTRSKIPKAPVELPDGDLDSFDVQFGSITIPARQTDTQEDYKHTESPSPVDEQKTFSNATLQESEASTSNEQLSSHSAPKSNEGPGPNSPPPKNGPPVPSRSPVPQDKQPSISAPPTSHQPAIPTPVTVPPHSQPHQQYHQHMGRQNERKSYSENNGKMHHQGGMSGNSVKLQQHPQMAPPVNSIDPSAGMPYLMTPMGTVGGPNAIPPTSMSNLPRGPAKNFQTPVIYNPSGQFGMVPNYYWDHEFMRAMSQSNNPASNMVKDQNSNQIFPNSDAKFHEPTSPANPQTGMQGQNLYVPFHGYGFIPGMIPMIPKGNSYPNPVTAGGQTPFPAQPPLPPNIPPLPDQHTDYKANFTNIQQKPGAITQPADIQNMYKGYDQKSALPFGFGYPIAAQYMNPQMIPQQQPQYSNLTPNMLMQQPLDAQRPKW